MQANANENWITDVACSADLFMHSYSGYWLRRMEYDRALGSLALDMIELPEALGKAVPAAVEGAWRAGRPLPKGWYRIDRAFGEKALAEGQKKYGEDFAEEYDGCSADVAVQRALLGDVLYG